MVYLELSARRGNDAPFQAQGSVDPKWVDRVHESHVPCRVGGIGGLLFCSKCGSVTQVSLSKSTLFNACPRQQEGKVPRGSKFGSARLLPGGIQCWKIKFWSNRVPWNRPMSLRKVSMSEPPQSAVAAMEKEYDWVLHASRLTRVE